MAVILALALKDLRILVRLRAGLFFTFVWPLVVAILFGTIFSGEGHSARTGIAVVDEDATTASADFVSRLEKVATLQVVRADREHALSLVRAGKRTAAIVIPRGFGEAASRMFYGTPPTVDLWIDPSRAAESGMLQGLLFKQGAERMQAMMADTSASREMVRKARENLGAAAAAGVATQPTDRFLGELDRYLQTVQPGGQSPGGVGSWQPLAVQEKAVVDPHRGPFPTNSYELTFPQGILWGIIGCVMTFGLGIVSERSHGTMVRLQMSPISRAQLLGGKALACFAAIAIVETGLFLVGRVFFGVRPASWALLVLAGVCAAVAFVGVMMLVSVLGKTEQAAAGAGWAIMMPLTMLGGGMIPLFIMPSWMAAAGTISPAKWAILAFEGAIWRGFSTAEMLLPCTILVAVGLVCFTVGTRAFRPAA
jgi:ABC-2 type transport system permease protein